MRRALLILPISAIGLLNGVDARAEGWPTRPITMVMPYAAGGPTDKLVTQGGYGGLDWTR